MTTFVYRNGKLVDKREADPLPSHGTAPYVISDTMPLTKHHGTNRWHDSKAKFRADTKAIGAIELGNEMPPARKPEKLDKGQRRDAIRKAIYDLKNGYKPTIPDW